MIEDYFFAESAIIPASQARIFWSAEVDPTTLTVHAKKVRSGAAGIDLARLSHLATMLVDKDGHEHLSLSDGRQWLRIDIISGNIRNQPVCLHFVAESSQQLRYMAGSLATLTALLTHGRFSSLPRQHNSLARRQIDCLRTHDALASGASQRQIAIGLFGYDRVIAEWNGASDAMRSQIRRLCKSAQLMASGGYKGLLQ